MVNTENIQWAIFIAMLAMLMMAVFVIAFVIYYQKKQLEQEKKLREIEKNYQRMLLETALDSEESERRRIAQDLHDDIGTMLSLTKLSLNQLSKIMNKEESRTEFTFNKVQSLVEETILHVRRITRDLVPTTLEQFGLAAAIEDFVRKLGENNTLSVQFHCQPDAIPRQSQKVELTLYRIMQELVNNAIKHSQGNEIEIELLADKDKIQLLVSDNGRGFDLRAVRESKRAGLGLRSIESRLSVVDGVMQYHTLSVPGCRAGIQVPIERNRGKKPEPLHPFRRERSRVQDFPS
ncbi:hypothetical protein GCM10027275_38080 [Rhabdobacter roseus]|uniref:Signal transduction histidine kinase n=1 Tax=Rhabdobacter roseus TaxID=1655419 RepID=A0A840TR37_9BACT|nr:sensor histidine kinase [Rhabdobacter roseus]MBB5285784.1 signal transduction histidine kinase [Rhabdobacter roseus]